MGALFSSSHATLLPNTISTWKNQNETKKKTKQTEKGKDVTMIPGLKVCSHMILYSHSCPFKNSIQNWSKKCDHLYHNKDILVQCVKAEANAPGTQLWLQLLSTFHTISYVNFLILLSSLDHIFSSSFMLSYHILMSLKCTKSPHTYILCNTSSATPLK